MTAEPVGPVAGEGERVPRNAEGIAAALEGGRRLEFYRQLLAARPEDAEAVLRRWWCEAMLDTDPAAGRAAAAAMAGTLPTTPLEDVLAHRRAAGAAGE